MAKQKKKKGSAKKAVKRVAKKVSRVAKKVANAAKKPIARRNAAPAPVLSLEERNKLLKPRTDFIGVLEHVTREWSSYRALRVPGLSSAKLASLGKKAVRATEKENTVAEAMNRKLAPLADARRIANDAAYRALLDTHAAVKLHARLDPGIVERFSFLSDLVRNQQTPTDANDPETPAEP